MLTKNPKVTLRLALLLSIHLPIASITLWGPNLVCAQTQVTLDRPGPTPTATPSISPLPPHQLRTDERLITILGTNDIHGGIEPVRLADGSTAGGLAQWMGALRAIREGLARQYPQQSGTLLVDAGDQFQGTLISNINEGRLVFELMSQMGYDAVVTGNHDYDFGPRGWLTDRVQPGNVDQDPRGALREALGAANFPLISANTYLKQSLKSQSGQPIAVEGVGCRPLPQPQQTGAPTEIQLQIDWAQAHSPDFLRPAIVKSIAGVRVAVIGLDHPQTPLTTTSANVSDLCFDDPVNAYLRAQGALAKEADVFVLVIHDGNSNTEYQLSKLVGDISERRPNALHAVIAGHTHFVNDLWIGQIPVIQSGANGKMFGRIDLVYSTATQRVLPERTRKYAGFSLNSKHCPEDPIKSSFCQVGDGNIAYEGVNVTADTSITTRILAERTRIAPIADRVLGRANAEIGRDRILENPLSNAITDALRLASGADLALVNTGGLRASIPGGSITFENLIRVLPFNNRAVLIGPMGVERLLALLRRTIQTCGAFGSLMQSGLKVQFSRNCAAPVNGLDPNARLLRVETVSGELIYDLSSNTSAPSMREFRIVTLDFLTSGGDGFVELSQVPQFSDLGIAREVISQYWLDHAANLSTATDGRWAISPPPPSGHEH